MVPKSFSIKNWSEDDQPREKLRDKGSRFLSDAELIAILIGSGTVQESAVDLSKRILSSVQHDLQGLGQLTIAQLMMFKGIGEAKAVKIRAAMELSRRRREASLKRLNKINSSLSVFELMHPLLGHLAYEEFWVLYLNNSNKILAKTQIQTDWAFGVLIGAKDAEMGTNPVIRGFILRYFFSPPFLNFGKVGNKSLAYSKNEFRVQ